MNIVHISDSHGAKYHNNIIVPECDVLIHTGDLSGRTNIMELNEFLIWYAQQPAKVKIFIGGNHDLVLDSKEAIKQKQKGNIVGWLRMVEEHKQVAGLIESYGIKYLNGKDYVYKGLKFYGSPYSPSFHRENWAFNLDKGVEIQKEWAKIPSDTAILLTHTPPYGYLDVIREKFKSTPDEDIHRGCIDLMNVIKKRLFNLKLHAFGHIHDQSGTIVASVSGTRHVRFSNGAVITNEGKQLITNPLIITI